MTMTLTGTGGVFTRIGRMGGLLNALNVYRLTTIKANYDNIYAQFASTDQEVIPGLYPNWASFEVAGNVASQYMKTIAKATLREMVKDDQHLVDVTDEAAMAELIRQMVASSDTVELPTVSVSVAAGGSNNGDGTLIASKLDGRGIQQDYIFAETIRARCILDSQRVSGPATEGKEKFQALAQVATADTTSQDWPTGSGADVQLTAVTPDDNASQTTCLLTNGDMESFTGNTPDNWTVDTGTPGTQILKTTANQYRGTSGMEYVGHATAASIYQKFDTSGQTTAQLEPNTVYGFNVWVKTSGSPAAGAISYSLTDSTGTVINDDAGTANTVTLSLSGSPPTSWTKLNGFFRTPRVMPSEVRLRAKLTTALSVGTSLYWDDICLTPATQLYDGGPFVAVFSGATKFVEGATINQADIFTITAANDYASKWQKLAEQFFGMRALGLQLPSVGGAAETIPDSLVA